MGECKVEQMVNAVKRVEVEAAVGPSWMASVALTELPTTFLDHFSITQPTMPLTEST